MSGTNNTLIQSIKAFNVWLSQHVTPLNSNSRVQGNINCCFPCKDQDYSVHLAMAKKYNSEVSLSILDFPAKQKLLEKNHFICGVKK